jgi:hypothetical protein
MSARDFPAKLARAAEALGCRTQKELLAQLLAVNPRTSFDPARSYKWLKGRSTPRDPGVYQDLANALGLRHPGELLRACSLDAFDAMLAARAAQPPAVEPTEGDRPDLSYLDGVYVMYMRSFSQFPTSKIFFCRLTVATGPTRLTSARLDVPLAGRVSRYFGTVGCAGRLVSAMLQSETRGTTAILWFADPAAPARAIGALIGGQVAFIAAAIPKCTRAALIRVPGDDVDLAATDCYCEVDEGDLARTLEMSGHRAARGSGMAHRLLEFLSPTGDEVAISVPVEDSERLMASVERAWRMAESSAA